MIHRYRATPAALFRNQAGVRRITTRLELTDLQGSRTGARQIASVMIDVVMAPGDGMVVEAVVAVEVAAVDSLEGTTLAAEEVGIWTAGTLSSKEEDTNQYSGMNTVAATTEDKAETSMVTEEEEIHDMNHAGAQVATLGVAVAKIRDRNNCATPMSDMSIRNNAVAMAVVVMIDTARRSTTSDHRNVRVIETAAVATAASNPGTTGTKVLAMTSTLTVVGLTMNMKVDVAMMAITMLLPLPTALTTTVTEDVRIITATKIAPTPGVAVITIDNDLTTTSRAMTNNNNKDIGNATTMIT
jgi:hypothetical protein